ncbi:hypothetical protein LOAG_10980 [Loa loa]|uniref:Uncharacterized protein n=1 Tax=Loa loa TaxID=7209 RepID=A0A1S0TNR6_LOALO|nr:hypothetical protein LOAG_10980 [Loa loa]EFO17520.1 hypothetical protein LOAG_10980 [Loa loa]
MSNSSFFFDLSFRRYSNHKCVLDNEELCLKIAKRRAQHEKGNVSFFYLIYSINPDVDSFELVTDQTLILDQRRSDPDPNKGVQHAENTITQTAFILFLLSIITNNLTDTKIIAILVSVIFFVIIPNQTNLKVKIAYA